MRRVGSRRPFVAGKRCAAPPGVKEVFFFFLFLVLVAPGAALDAVPPVPPRPARYVTDLAAAVPADRAAALNEKLAAFERATSNQVLVYVDRKVPEGTTLEEFANAAFHAWGVGQKGKSNGVVFFLFTGDRKMRMEVGYGLEGAIPDARAHRIDAEVIAPLLKAGDVAGALDAGTDAILAAARGEPYAGTGQTAAEKKRGTGKIASTDNNIWVVLFPILFIGGLFLIIGILFIARRKAKKTDGSSGWVSSFGFPSSSSSSSSSSSDSSSSGSDFSGGGGDSGGGGSSDSY